MSIYVYTYTYRHVYIYVYVALEVLSKIGSSAAVDVEVPTEDHGLVGIHQVT